MTGNASGLASHTFLKTSITTEDISKVLHDLEPVLVKGGTDMSFGDSETNGVGETLTQRTSGDFDTVSMMVFRVSWGLGIDLTEIFQVLKGEFVSEEM